MKVVSLTASVWRFRDCSASQWIPATVPGCVHTDLQKAGLIPDPFFATNEAALQWISERDWEYATEFMVSAAVLAEETVELVADGLDTVAAVHVNGVLVGRTDNMFLGHRWDVKALLRPGPNVLAIRFASAMEYIRTERASHRPREINDPVGGATIIRKEQCQFGWDWGPRFVTAGIWLGLRLEAWSGNRLESVAVTQVHGRDGGVTLTLAPELARKVRAVRISWRLKGPSGKVQEGTGRRIVVRRPQKWWPAGQGDQPLYLLEVTVAGSANAWAQRIGLRTVELDRRPDPWGESFQFKVNGRAIFAKGANWIPAHTFVAGLGRADYARDLRAAVAAHMNMVRVWGGGIYEAEAFYDLCDQLGLMVWQDFMFACTVYPGDEAFIASCRAEAAYQVRRLRHRACLALWCGNNEIWSINAPELQDPKKREIRRHYEHLFHRVLPAEVKRHDPATAYWPSSPWRDGPAIDHPAGEVRGDTHFWDVWHGRNPVKDYEKWNFRFVSEFGMQSYCSPATQATFCPPGEANVFGAAMENHQKNKGGNQVVLDYISRRYRFPCGQSELIYLSQLNQLDCVQTGVAHYRRLMPRCMGALYWQLNDCWPVASWSSIEFTGRWRALHHAARRFFAPACVSAHVPGEEVFILNNYRHSTVDEVHLYTSSDGPKAETGRLRWDLFHLDGTVVESGSRRVRLEPMRGTRQATLRLGAQLAKFGREHLYLRIALDLGGRCVSSETVLFTLPRFIALPRARPRVKWVRRGRRRAAVTLTSPVFQHRCELDLAGLAFSASDNYFDLYPGEPRTVELELAAPASLAALRRAFRHRSLADTY